MSYITVPGTDPNGGVRMVHEADTGDPLCDTRGWTHLHDSLPIDFPICPVCLPDITPKDEVQVVDGDTPTPTPKPKRRRKRKK